MGNSMEKFMSFVVMLCMLMNFHVMAHDYGDALTKSILFFEGQRSGKLPYNQRMTWRGDSALNDGSDAGVDLTGGYYDAGDNVKFNFPMAFTTAMLSWSVIEFGSLMGPDQQHAFEAIRWGTDYLLKATATPDVVYAGVGDPTEDHDCWERPEDMDTPRTTYALTKEKPGSETSGEIAAALSAASLAFKYADPNYSKLLLQRAITVFEFGDKYRGSYNDSLGSAVCPFYCDFNGYQDELIWAATWLYKATNTNYYLEYVKRNITVLDYNHFGFGWDSKFAGIIIINSELPGSDADIYIPLANKVVCSVLPDSPTKVFEYTQGGLMFKKVGSNLQHAATMPFLMLVYARILSDTKTTINCGNLVVDSEKLISFANSQVDYVLGSNPMKMSYMVGYGDKYPEKIHHRASSIPSIANHPSRIGCRDGDQYFFSNGSDPNQLTGAIVGGPQMNDYYADSRDLFRESEPTTYINAPFVGTLAFFKARASQYSAKGGQSPPMGPTHEL